MTDTEAGEVDVVLEGEGERSAGNEEIESRYFNPQLPDTYWGCIRLTRDGRCCGGGGLNAPMISLRDTGGA